MKQESAQVPGAGSQGTAPDLSEVRPLTDRQRLDETLDYLTMLGAEKLRAATATPAERERFAVYKKLSAMGRQEIERARGGTLRPEQTLTHGVIYR